MANRDERIYGEKKIPMGFFDLPRAENISAVLFSSAGTLPKFNRMGLRAGFVPENHMYIRQGFRYNPSPDAYVRTPFQEDAPSPEYEEYRSDELHVFHNPNARNPICPDTFGGITQYFFKDGDLHTITPGRAVITSFYGGISV